MIAVSIGLAGAGARAEARPAADREDRAGWQARAIADTDSVAPDSARLDSLPGDSLPADSVGVADSLPAAEEASGEEDAPQDTGFPEQDELFRQLQELGGFRSVEYQGREVGLEVENEIVRLNDEALARYGGSALEADTIVYRASAELIEAHRNISLAGEGQNITSETTLYYDVSGLRGTVLDARTSFAEAGAEWYVRGDATLRGDERAFVETGSFTSCELDEPHYHFQAGQIKVVRENIIVAWPVTLYINHVPVAWLPFFAQDIRQGRRSGFLPPRFGVSDIVSTSDGVRRQISDFGYYWAINDFLDAQATVDWFSGRYTRVNGAFRYRFLKKHLQGNARLSYNFGDRRTFDLQLDHRQELSPVTDFVVDAQFIQSTEIFEDQSINPEDQTQTIASNVGFNHRFPFASMNFSARRRQFLGAQRGNTDLTLPQFNLSFSPLTLFRAPRNRAGAFNNITLSGGMNFQRQENNREDGDDQTRTMATANSSIRVGSVSLGGSANYNEVSTTPFDDAVDPFSRTTLNYSGNADYQVDLMGSTTLRPTVSIAAAAFRSPDTESRFISAPARISVGATLSTDLYGFFPGFGPFSRIRHKFSPRFRWDLSPETSVADSLRDIPGFPAAASLSRNSLSITLNQTFEAKVREDVQLDAEERALLEGLDPDSVAAADSLAALDAGGTTDGDPDDPAGAPRPAGAPGEASDSTLTVESDSTAVVVADSAGVVPSRGVVGRTPSRTPGQAGPQRRPQRNVVLLAINSNALVFDFAREGGSPLVTDRWSHSINSDLLRGLSLNLALDLFDGAGEEREFSPILSTLTGSFSFSSARGLGGILGLGGGSRGNSPGRRIRDEVDSRYRLQDFEENPDPRDRGAQGGGPWTLGLTYSLQRSRESEASTDRQTIGANLALQPTPNLRLRWNTNYNLTDGEFGQHTVTLDRDLHRWMASFAFVRAPNGNLLFQLSVRLRDAPDLKVDYDQQTLNR